MQAAIQRADELNRLRDLSDTPAHAGIVPEAPKIAALPSGRSDADPDDDEDELDRLDHAATVRDHSDRNRRALGVRTAGVRAGGKAAGGLAAAGQVTQ